MLATYVDGGLGDLAELVHEGGHACHIAAIRTRPAYADWPDSDALTEALAEVVGLDVAEPAWLARWIPEAAPLSDATSLRCRYADVVLDTAWALFEIRLHAEPDRTPNEVWTAITADYLGIAPHPEWSWWAMRGQLVQEPGYMANYSVGAVLAADLRAAIRAARGDWTGGDPGWYALGLRARLPVRAGALRGRRAARRPGTPTGRARAGRGDRPGPRLSDGRR